MEIYKVKFVRISVYGDIDNVRYRVMLDKEIPGYRVNVDGQIMKDTVNYIDIAPNALVAQVIKAIPDLGAIHAFLREKNIRGGNGSAGVDAAQIQVYLNGADVTINRTEFAPGEEYTTSDGEVRVHEFAGFSTNIADITITDTAKRRLERAIDTILLGGL